MRIVQGLCTALLVLLVSSNGYAETPGYALLLQKATQSNHADALPLQPWDLHTAKRYVDQQYAAAEEAANQADPFLHVRAEQSIVNARVTALGYGLAIEETREKQIVEKMFGSGDHSSYINRLAQKAHEELKLRKAQVESAYRDAEVTDSTRTADEQLKKALEMSNLIGLPHDKSRVEKIIRKNAQQQIESLRNHVEQIGTPGASQYPFSYIEESWRKNHQRLGSTIDEHAVSQLETKYFMNDLEKWVRRAKAIGLTDFTRLWARSNEGPVAIRSTTESLEFTIKQLADVILHLEGKLKKASLSADEVGKMQHDGYARLLDYIDKNPSKILEKKSYHPVLKKELQRKINYLKYLNRKR